VPVFIPLLNKGYQIGKPTLKLKMNPIRGDQIRVMMVPKMLGVAPLVEIRIEGLELRAADVGSSDDEEMKKKIWFGVPNYAYFLEMVNGIKTVSRVGYNYPVM